jgi:hypothetical protein
MMSQQTQLNTDTHVGTRDGFGAGDHDQPYRFGWKPRASAPYPFNTRQYGRLLVMRGRVQDGLVAADDGGLLPRAA